MTMIYTYRHFDKIIMMSDSRISKETKDGSFDYQDNELKIHPFENRFVIGHSGRGKIIENGKQLKVDQVIEHFFRTQIHLPRLTARDVMQGLIDTWNLTLTHSMNLNPHKHIVCFVICEWDGDTPRIYVGRTDKDVILTKSYVAIGDDELYPIVDPYCQVNVNEMSLEESIFHFKQAFQEVSSKVRTVGGFISIYALGRSPLESGWIQKGDFV